MSPDWIKYESKGGADRKEPAKQIDFTPIKFDSVDDKLFDTIAESVAKAISKDGRTTWDKKGKCWKEGKNLIQNKSTQLRKFYDELNMWHDKVFEYGVDREAKYKELAPFIKMLCAKVTYAKGREHVSEGFEKLFTHVIRAVNSPATLKHAKLFIEAFMGFYKAEEK